MKRTCSALLVLLLFALGACTNPQTTTPVPVDLSAEYAALEETREGFTSAIREGRYQDLGMFTTQDAKTVGPASSGWLDMYAQGAARNSPFPYDSIVMVPTETVIVSDSVAYDMGNSVVYYTDSLGNQAAVENTFLAILKKGSDGVWRLHREVASGQVVK